MSLSPIPQSPSQPDPISDPPPESESDPTDLAMPRKLTMSKRSKKSKAASEKYLAMGEQKLSVLKQKTLKMVPCSVSFTLSKHESLFRLLGLWDFAQLSLDKAIREDLVMQLIAFYDPNGRKSMVNGVRILVSRADLARALSLPVKKKSGEDLKEESFDSDDSTSVLSQFISSYMLFHLQEDEEDACILPQEVLSATQLIKEGQANKVDWAGLIWGFVEKELQEVSKTGICYYASHLQQLIRYQQPKLLEPVPEAENSVDPTMVDDDEEEEEADQDPEQEQEGEDIMDTTARDETGLNLGLGSDPIEGGEVNWGLRQCSSSGFGLLEFENLDPKPDNDMNEFDEQGEQQFMNSFERLNSSTHLLQAMQNVNSASNANQFDNGNFLSISRENDDHTHNHNNNNSDSFYYGKRPLSEINDDDDDDNEDDDDDDDDGGGGGDHLHAKRMRNSGNFNYNNNIDNDNNNNNMNVEEQSDFFTMMDKAKMQYAQKEQALMNAQMEIQYASSLIQQKDQVIHQLEKSSLEDQAKYQSELCRYEHELNVMAQLVSGYKKALKQIRVSFSEYRRKFPEGEEREKTVYGDVPNGGGLVVSRKELERMQLEREMEMREVAVKLVGEFEREWLDKFQGYGAHLEQLERKMVVINGEIAKNGEDKGGANEEIAKNGEDEGVANGEIAKNGEDEGVANGEIDDEEKANGEDGKEEEEKTSLPMDE